jgi:hypothetical protein
MDQKNKEIRYTKTRILASSLCAVLILSLWVLPATAQLNSNELKLSLGASAGLAPTLTYGSSEDSGALLNLFGDLRYQNVFGKLQFTYVLANTLENESFSNGYGFFGALGYALPVNDRIEIPMMAIGGASIISYEAQDNYKDVSPQVGFGITPLYRINESLSLYTSLRYLKGFKGSEESDPIDVMDLTAGIRITLTQ